MCQLMMMQVVGGWVGGVGGWGGRWVGGGGVGGWGVGGGRWGGLPPLPTHPPLRFTREQTRVEYIRRCRLMTLKNLANVQNCLHTKN